MAMLRTLFLFATLVCVSLSSTLFSLSAGSGKYTFSRIQIQHREHKGMGFDEGYSTIGVFACPNVNTVGMPFFDAKLHVFNNAYLASNVGIGCRFSNSDESMILGLNGYYDYRNYKSLSVHQGSGGIELMGRTLSLRLNGYYPFSGKFQEDNIYFRMFQGNSALVQQKIRYALPSADGEIGFNLPPPFEQLGLYIGIGGYYLFKQKGFFGFQNVGNVPGARGRVRATPVDWFSIGVDYTYDKLFKSRFNGFASFNIPLGPRTLKGSKKGRFPYKKSESDLYLEWMKLKTQDVIRNEIVPIYNKAHRFPHVNEAGEPYLFIFVNNTGTAHIGQGDDVGTGDGTFEDPYTTIRLADLNAPEDAVVYVFFGDGTTRNYDQGYGFKSGQIMSSSGADLTLNGVLVPAFTPGEYARVTNTDGDVFTGSDLRSITINGFHVETENASGVNIQSTGVTLTNNKITGSNGISAVRLQDPLGNTYIQNNEIISGGGSVGGNPLVDISSMNGSFSNIVYVKGNVFQAKDGQDAVFFGNLYDSIFVINNIAKSESSLGTAFEFFSQIKTGTPGCSATFHGNRIEEGFKIGIAADWNSDDYSRLKVKNNTITSSTLDTSVFYNNLSLEANGGGNAVIASNTLVTNSSDAAVLLQNYDRDADRYLNAIVSGNTILVNNPAGSGIYTKSKGIVNLTAENNTINYSQPSSGSAAITYELSSTLFRESELVISDNIINSKATPGTRADIFVLCGTNSGVLSNEVNAKLNARIDGNGGIGIRVQNQGAQPICLRLDKNNLKENLSGYSIYLEKNSASRGDLAVFSQSAANAGNIEGIRYIQGSQPNGNVFTSYTLDNAFIVDPGLGCPPFQAIFINNTAPARPSNIPASYEGSYWYPYRVLVDTDYQTGDFQEKSFMSMEVVSLNPTQALLLYNPTKPLLAQHPRFLLME